MKAVMVTAPGKVEMVDVPEPTPGPRDILLRPRACGICGSDLFYISIGGIPPRQGQTILGHEPAGEIVMVGAEVEGLAVGDHVVVNPQGDSRGIIGNGGPTGALSELLIIHDAVRGHSVEVIPDDLPFDIASLNEPMAVARHAVNRSKPQPGQKVVVFGAGPIGLGATISYKSLGVAHVIVVDILPTRLERALTIGADAVINSAEEDMQARLLELHGPATDATGKPRVGTDIYLDAAGVPSIIQTALACAKHRATVCIPAIHKKPVPVDFGQILASEVDIVLAMGYPNEIFEVTDDIIANRDQYGAIISHRFDFSQALEALQIAMTPGASEKVLITFPPTTTPGV